MGSWEREDTSWSRHTDACSARAGGVLAGGHGLRACVLTGLYK